MKTTLNALFLYLLCVAFAWGEPGILPQLPKPNIVCDMKVDDAEYGLAVVSVTLPASKVGIGNPNKFNVYYNTSKGSGFLSNKTVTLIRETLFGKTDTDFADDFGQLFVLKLKAGDYELRGWDYMDVSAAQDTYGPTAKLEPIPFQVTAGRASYLGSLAVMMKDAGKNVLGMRTVIAWPTLADRGQRDLSVLFKKCPAIDIMQVDVALLDLSPWSKKISK
jgi:hypothetical protein